MCTAGRLLKALKKIGKRFIRGTTSSAAATLAKRDGLHKRSW